MPEHAPELDGSTSRPPWADGDPPSVDRYVESELFVAGALSTMPPFDTHHPAYCLPFARQALDALSKWEPSDSLSPGERHVSNAERIERLTVAAEAALRHLQLDYGQGNRARASVVLGLKAALEA